MGWLEVLAMLKRLLPLLTRVSPMLETFLATRAAGRDDSAMLERVAGELKSDFITTTAAHRTETQAALAEQAAELRDIRMELKHLREEQAARLGRIRPSQCIHATVDSSPGHRDDGDGCGVYRAPGRDLLPALTRW